MKFFYRPQGLARLLLAAVLGLAALFAYGEDYLGRDEFLELAFPDSQPQMRTLWVTDETREAASAALGWIPRGLRLRYWQYESRTAWILEEVGKEKPITVGIVVDEAQIEQVAVMAFRESRGWEIRYPFFTEQFSGLDLAPDGYLSQTIDGITGATLSVRAVEHIARRALWLDAQVDG